MKALSTQAPSNSSRSLRTFIYAYALIGACTSAPSFFRKRSSTTNVDLLSVALDRYLDPRTVKTALFPAILPPVYHQLSSLYPESGNAIRELLASPLLALLPHGWRIQAALYFAGAALQSSARESRLRAYLPPIWWLTIVSNTWLLWAFLTQAQSFPKNYERLLCSHPNYTPKNWSAAQVREFLNAGRSWSLLTPENAPEHAYKQGHTRLFCATLHPDEPSCTKNYIKAWIFESRKVVQWVGLFGALTTVLTRRKLLRENPHRALRDWITSTIRGTVFIVGSMNTAWGLMCPLQRILPPDAIPRARWLINGSLGSIWVLALERGRRAEISMYIARLGALCLWDVWKHSGGYSIKFGEILIFGLSWAQLSKVRREGGRVRGLVGLSLGLLDNA